MPKSHLKMHARVLGGTALALVLAGAANAQPIEQVVVTGTHIRGVAPVGSTVISVGTEDLAKTGVSSTSDLLLKIPQFVNLGFNETTQVGGNRFQQNAGNTTFSRSINLRGITPEATLTLFNGHRHTKGILSSATDIDTYPMSLVERIEVVADGASAIYGTDAVAGIANVILRKPQDTMQTMAQMSVFDGGANWLVEQSLGTTWSAERSGIGEGGILLAYQHSYTDPLDAAQRPNLYNDDFSPYIGAVGLPPTFASPGNVRGFGGTAAAQATLYAVPTGLAANQALELGRLGTAGAPNRQSAWFAAVAAPQITRDTFAGIFEQELTDWMKFSSFGSYTKRNGGATYGTTPTIQSTITVPNTNPYSPCATPAARAAAGLAPASPANTQGLVCPANGSVTLLYAWAKEFSASTLRDFSQIDYHLTGKFDIELPYEWHGAVSAYYGKSYGNAFHHPTVNNTALAQVVSGTGKPANVPFFNPFCDNTAAPCNAQITRDYVAANFNFTNTNWLANYSASVNGRLFDLPGGSVRVALGGDYYEQFLRVYNYDVQSAAIGTRVTTTDSNGRQRAKSLFAELYVPIIGQANAMPGIQSLELTVAGRTTDYSTFGTTNDPKFGVNWSPVSGVKVHGSWGTSFRAPNLRDSDPAAAATLFVLNTTTCGQLTGEAQIGPCAAGANGALSHLTTSSGNAAVRPETATTWSIGADWTPPEIPGLYASLTYYNIDYQDTITAGPRNIGDIPAVNSGLYDQYVIYNPTFYPTLAPNNPAYTVNGTPMQTNTQAFYNAFVVALRTEPAFVPVTTPTANPIVFVVDARRNNTGALLTDGLDFVANYNWDLDWGGANVGISGTYVFNYDVTAVTTSPLVEQVNQFGFVMRYRLRGEAGLEIDRWNATMYVNYSPSYSASPTFMPATAPVQFQSIDSYTTVDLSVGYNTGEEISIPLLRNIQLNLVATNIFDQDPPLVLNGAGANAIQFDPHVASAIGRLITFRVAKAW